MTNFEIVVRACAATVIALTSIAAVGLQQGCSSSLQEELKLARLAQSCLVNSDCADPLVCAFKACHTECESSRDCDDGARCVAAARPYKVCQLESERTCERDSHCPDGLICGIDHECRDQCLSDVNCVEGQLCVSGTCADPDELDDEGQLVPAPGASYGEEGTPCVYVSDCAEALLCRSQTCLPECKADKDCGVGRKCEQSRCVDDGSQPQSCVYSSTCTKPGERCLNGTCLCMCVEDRDCPAGEQCAGCGCEPKPAPAGACVYNSDCKEAGKICRSGQCACECKADVDCGAGAECDGCGCFDVRDPLDGVVRGTVQIGSALELQIYRGVTEIQGDLIIGGAVIGDLGDTFEQLRSIHGSLLVQQTKALATLSFPALEHAAALTLNDNTALTSADFRALESAVITLTQMQSLTTLSLDALDSGSLQLTRLGALKKLRLPVATELSQFQVHECAALEAIELPELTAVSGNFQVKSLANTQQALTSLFTPKLSKLGHLAYAEPSSLIIDHTQLTTLAGFMAAPEFVHPISVQISSNPLLGSCAVDSFETHAKKFGLKAVVDAFDNLTCAACADDSCCANGACPE